MQLFKSQPASLTIIDIIMNLDSSAACKDINAHLPPSNLRMLEIFGVLTGYR